MVPVRADEPITVAFAAPMTAAQQTWLCRTRAHVRSIAFNPLDSASVLLLTDRHSLHARLEEAHDVHVGSDGCQFESPAPSPCQIAAALTALPRFAALRVLGLRWGTWLPEGFLMALPCGLRHLTVSGTFQAELYSALRWLQHLGELQVCIPRKR